MAEIIGPDGRTYYTPDHKQDTKSTKQKSGFLAGISDYLTLIGGVIAILIAFRLLADIAIGLFLLFVGATSVNYWMMRNK